MSELQALYQELIIDHGRHPRNCHAMDDATAMKTGFNPLCGDKLILFLKVAQEKMVDVSFQGSGCAISMASSSLMTEALKGKSIAEAKTIFEAFHWLVTTGDEKDSVSLGKLAVLKGVYAYPSRVKCATLAWHTMMAAIEHQSGSVSTE
ncbi:MAG: SUF system NifU family Fe-S cluster assembly protein [Gammaproteobacteria bacterium CG_4_10_14_0_8_um_filter_38_16]|nr:MAG: SUF system NifU family Fe-S cluster assembly protein [Gammaproteobacteria bacterium CG_4_10_14_0_8_um_filter_38_16]PJA02614.1 MAG: SUF system NifU family Fe-S cluster assembly protein [Gammaproteobacteria bacterium CG_4_10_14_0_2_um_filter_38_22]PJB11070.1 MAG: SUF system NifU family Fe-S cluster assembly protein [Gammaproteobacteria bacterium CG_4_9_14_3_um_filter_38_9]